MLYQVSSACKIRLGHNHCIDVHDTQTKQDVELSFFSKINSVKKAHISLLPRLTSHITGIRGSTGMDRYRINRMNYFSNLIHRHFNSVDLWC